MKSIFNVPHYIPVFPVALGGRCSKTVVGVNNGIDGCAIRSSLATQRWERRRSELPGEFWVGGIRCAEATLGLPDRIATSFFNTMYV